MLEDHLWQWRGPQRVRGRRRGTCRRLREFILVRVSAPELLQDEELKQSWVGRAERETGRRAEGRGESSACVESARTREQCPIQSHTRPPIQPPEQARVHAGGWQPVPRSRRADRTRLFNKSLLFLDGLSTVEAPGQNRGLEGSLADQTRHPGQQILASNSCTGSRGCLHFSEKRPDGGRHSEHPAPRTVAAGALATWAGRR